MLSLYITGKQFNSMYRVIKNHKIIAGLCIIILSACSGGELPMTESSPVSKGKSKSKSYSYEVRGKTYHVNKSIKHYSKTGIASWYGPGFHGKKTANGEIYNQNAMTAAHKTLPLGSIVEVKNLKNGKTITVRINDRGPFKPGRIIDLSHKGAKKIGMLNDGVVKVRVTLVKLANGKKAEKGIAILSDNDVDDKGDLKGEFDFDRATVLNPT